jgi:hypothetical protein
MAQNRFGFRDQGRFIIDRNKYDARHGPIAGIETEFSRALWRQDSDSRPPAAGFRQPRMMRRDSHSRAIRGEY